MIEVDALMWFARMIEVSFNFWFNFAFTPPIPDLFPDCFVVSSFFFSFSSSFYSCFLHFIHFQSGVQSSFSNLERCDTSMTHTKKCSKRKMNRDDCTVLIIWEEKKNAIEYHLYVRYCYFYFLLLIIFIPFRHSCTYSTRSREWNNHAAHCKQIVTIHFVFEVHSLWTCWNKFSKSLKYDLLFYALLSMILMPMTMVMATFWCILHQNASEHGRWTEKPCDTDW